MNGDATAPPSSDPNRMQEQVRGDTPAPFLTPHPDFATYGDSRLKLAEGLINEEIEAERCSGNRLQTAHMENRMRALQAEKRRRNGFSANAALNTQPTLADEAFHGLAGDVVKAIAPYTEAADVALLVNTLAAFGNIIGSSAHARVVTDQHPGRLFVAQVGDTSKGRKNSGWSPIKYLFSLVDAAALIIGIGLSAWQGRRFLLQWRPHRSWAAYGAGGMLMGIGAAMIPGGNDVLILHGIPSLSPHAIPAFLAMLGGIAISLTGMRALGLNIPRIDCSGDICTEPN